MKKNAELLSHKPTFVTDPNQLEKLKQTVGVHICDEINGQLRELIKLQNPTRRLTEEQYEELIKIELKGRDTGEYGEWVYYPWNNTLIHLLKEKEFIEVRTNRNQYKITPKERDELAKKKIGVIGLSVGQSIAITAAIERICGEIRLADFDLLELSNLNRIRTGLHNLGVPKVIIAAREIAEIDPYIKVEIFTDGLTENNIDEFFSKGGQLDLLVEVCDGLDMKIISRYKAKELKIPVVMDTNDRGMLDVERFDLEPDRPILHGLAGDLNPDNIKELTNEQKIPHVLKMIGAEQISARMKASMFEIEQSITTWPQLASSVVLGGALTVDVSRRILLDQYHESGRYYVDIEEQICDVSPPVITSYENEPKELLKEEQVEIAAAYTSSENSIGLTPEQLDEIIKAAATIPVYPFNYSPVKILYHNKQLFLFIDPHLSPSFLDHSGQFSYSIIGYVIENIMIKGASMGLDIRADYLPETKEQKLVSVLSFNNSKSPSVRDQELSKAIGLKIKVGMEAGKGKTILSNTLQEQITKVLPEYPGSELHIIDNEDLMFKLNNILSEAETINYVHPKGYFDIFIKKARWNNHAYPGTRFEIYNETSEKNDKRNSVYKLYSDPKVNQFLRTINGGGALKKVNRHILLDSPAFGMITMPSASMSDFILGGRLLERINLIVKLNGLSLQPSSELVFILEKLKKGTLVHELEGDFKHSLEKLKADFYALFPYLANRHPISIFRFF